MDATQKVRLALELEKDAMSRAANWQKPTVHAKVSILNADLNDRSIGLTGLHAKSNGLFLAEKVLIAAGRI